MPALKSSTQFLHPSLRDHYKKKKKKGIGRLEKPKEQMFPRNARKVSPMKSHQLDCLNKTCTRTAMRRLIWKWASTLDKELPAAGGELRARQMVFLREEHKNTSSGQP